MTASNEEEGFAKAMRDFVLEGKEAMKPARGSLFVYHDARALAGAAAKFMCDCATAKPGPFIVALSGGSTPKLTYETLAVEPLVARFPLGAHPFRVRRRAFRAA